MSRKPLVVLLLLAAVHPRAQAPDLSAVLATAGAQMARYAHDIDGVVIAEDYVQQVQVQGLAAEHLQSDLVLLADPVVSWIEFRDTTEVDGKPVEGRDARVLDLFSHPSPSALEQARRIVKEGARFNLATSNVRLNRTINLPLTALRFLLPVNQARSTFKLGGVEDVDGQQTTVVTFTESTKPRLIATPDERAAGGRFWLDPVSGAVHRTECQLESSSNSVIVTAKIRVDYVHVPARALWLPSLMTESYRLVSAIARSTIGDIQGRATYSDYRKFDVSVQDQQILPEHHDDAKTP